MFIFGLPVPLFLVCAVALFLFLGLRGLLVSRPLVIKTGVMYLALAPILLERLPLPAQESSGSAFPSLVFLIPMLLLDLLLAGLLIYFSKGYVFHFASQNDFRDALLYSLEKNNIKYAEKVTKIELTETDNALKVSHYNLYGMLSIQKRKDKPVFRVIIKEMKAYFTEKKVKAKKAAAVFYLAAGVLFAAAAASLAYFLNNIDAFINAAPQ
jgi:hypothetical protein